MQIRKAHYVYVYTLSTAVFFLLTYALKRVRFLKKWPKDRCGRLNNNDHNSDQRSFMQSFKKIVWIFTVRVKKNILTKYEIST